MTTAKKTVAAASAETITVSDDAVAASTATVPAPAASTSAPSTPTVEAVVKASAEATAKSVEKAVALSKEQVEAAVKAGDSVMAGYEDLLAYSKDNVEAVVASSTILAKGVQDVTKAVLTLAQASVEEGMAHSKAVAGVKSVHDLIELNSLFAKASLDKAMTDSGRLTDMTLKVVEAAVVPLSGRVEATVSRLLKPVAA